MFASQQRAVLHAINRNTGSAAEADCLDDTNGQSDAQHALRDLIDGSVSRREGNSCLVLGPKSSGKSTLVERVLAEFSSRAYIVRLHGYAQLSDRAAVRELSRQLQRQSGKTFAVDGLDNGDEEQDDMPVDTWEPSANSSLPPASHILSLISRLPSLPQPTIVVLDGLESFASHPRQALLYCLFDTAQSCRAAAGTQGLAVIAQSSRVDAITLLEKRVKSRFSHRIISVSTPLEFEEYLERVKSRLCASSLSLSDAWKSKWEADVNVLLVDNDIVHEFRKLFSISPDCRLLSRVLTAWVLRPQASSPYLTLQGLRSAISSQCGPPRFPFLSSLPYPALGLLISADHSRTAGFDVFTFEMLHEHFEAQIRTSSVAPVQQPSGISIGMLKCPRSVMFAAFEHLVSVRVFQSAGPATGIARQFWKYRCVPDHHDIKIAIAETGQMNLKKWLEKSTQA
ncbi:origin recognition complex subunit 4 C-terminus-domain-containing protein [Auriculariales sp. MPI-PUGE-AT-0066]|nr:origin recognition complex subunit 4 C-terminus-domain-containing protein [Auriculariales sp. MPI-PUGE-AT-0066]